MDWRSKSRIKGSPYRDAFNYLHKKLGRDLWASDVDLMLYDKYTIGAEVYDEVLALYELKRKGEYDDPFQFGESVLCNKLDQLRLRNQLLKIECFIIGAEYNPQAKNELEQIYDLDIYRYLYSDPRPHPPELEIAGIETGLSFVEFGQWEREYRQKRREEFYELLKNRQMGEINQYTVVQESHNIQELFLKEFSRLETKLNDLLNTWNNPNA